MLIYLPVGLNWGYLCLLQTHHGRRRGVLLERFSARGALELIQKERVTLHRHGAGLDRRDAQRPGARQITTPARCASSSPAARRRRSRPSAITRRG